MSPPRQACTSVKLNAGVGFESLEHVSKETYVCQKRPMCVKRDLGFESLEKREQMQGVQPQLLYLKVFFLCRCSTPRRVDLICDHLAGSVCEGERGVIRVRNTLETHE